MTTADAQQLRALVGAVHQPGDHRMAVAVRADAVWAGPELLDGTPAVRVVPCPSPLSVRAALTDHAHRPDEVLAMLTPCAERDLGIDVLARLAKGRVLSLDPFSAVLSLFRATDLDPSLVRERWLIDDLIEMAPPGGWPQHRPANGLLDLDRAWAAWHAERLPGVEAPTSLPEVLKLGDDPAPGRVLSELSPDRRARLAARWAGGVAPTDVLVERLAAGDGSDLLPLGLVVDVLWAVTEQARLAELQTLGRARLEPLLGRDRVDHPAAQAWATAAVEAIEHHPARSSLLDRAEQILVDADVVDLAVLSSFLPRGFDQRLNQLADALLHRDLESAAAVVDGVQNHDLASRRPERVNTAVAAVRLLRRSLQPNRAAAADLGDAINSYATDGAWLDDARGLLAEGDHLHELALAYASLCAAVDDDRRATSVRFATLLADWSKSEPMPHDGFLPLEHVLERIVAPIAADAPILLLVCDGMGLAVAHQLQRDLALEGWTSASPESRTGWPVGVAMLPTVTEVSRTSLFAGTRVEGGQAEERNGFVSHAALRAASSATRPPVLFHKSQLVGPNGRALPEEVRAAVADPSQRVVGVVVNAVDDHLNRGQQVRVGWDLNSLKPLAWLLDAATEAGRIVILTADHGHVLHAEGAVMRQYATAGGERWRTAPPPPMSDEVEVAGPRVLKGGRVVLPTDERLRYGGNKHGYHGGATPQEVLVPIAVLARTLPEGWRHRPMLEPAWWTGDRPNVSTPATRPTRRRPGLPVPQQTLFESEAVQGAPPEARTGWVDELLASPAFVAHRGQTRLPRPLADARLAAYLTAIAANGGSIPLTTLATRTGEPADQLRMALTMVQRLVNLDGAEILAIRGNQIVELNTELLSLQFGIDVA